MALFHFARKSLTTTVIRQWVQCSPSGADAPLVMADFFFFHDIDFYLFFFLLGYSCFTILC